VPVLTPVMPKHELCGRLVKALGITFPVERLVIEIDATRSQPVLVYVKAPVDAKAFEAMTTLFQTVNVGRVEVMPDTSLVVERAAP
jgi:hypothetical protein